MKLTIDVDYKVGDIVYSRIDPEQLRGIVTGYKTDSENVKYEIRFPFTDGYYSSVELSDVKDIVYKQECENADT